MPIVVFYNGGEPKAIDNRCPHMGFPLHRGTIDNGILAVIGIMHGSTSKADVRLISLRMTRLPIQLKLKMGTYSFIPEELKRTLSNMANVDFGREWSTTSGS
jgi:phenylpropionate dioxygenase-like ring-hydroxylating dioxygenase large terminal subunit